jgi:adenylylsulfate kinase
MADQRTNSGNVQWHEAEVPRAERFRLLSASGATIWLTGLSGSGKSTIACAIERQLLHRAVNCFRLDGDNLRLGINRDLTFSPEHRTENIRRFAEIAKLFAESGSVAIVSAISPFKADRASARSIHEQSREGPLPFFEVHVSTPLSICEARDPKGMYRRARAGEIQGFTGIDSPYEQPENADLVLDTSRLDAGACAAQCIELLKLRDVTL